MAHTATVTAALCRCSKITRIVDESRGRPRQKRARGRQARRHSRSMAVCVPCFSDTQRGCVQDDERTVLALPAPAPVDTPSPTAGRLPSGEKAQHRAIVSRIQDRTGRLASQSQMTTALSSPHVAMCDCDGCGARPQSRRSAWPAATGWPSCKARPSVAAASKISPPAVVTAKRSRAASQQTASTQDRGRECSRVDT